MRATLNDFKVILLWSIIAFLLVTVVGSLLFSLTGFSLLLIPIIVIGAMVYGFCSFKAANQLKGKTYLSWLNVAMLFTALLWLYGLSLSILFGIGHGSGNVVGMAAAFIGVYVSHKASSSSKKKRKV